MRSLLALILDFLRAVLGRRRAEAVQTASIRTLPALRCQRAADVIEADSLLLVKPYVAHERAQEGRRQGERQRAAVTTVVGQDYVPAVTE
ncbi:hypothetical protein [Streptomyces gibsoniae]|uniref:Secreted protein n=1 Tax=Streptomyces gibsoniae TaxID=3075529 RepID=A0ABU2U9F4_9ACTN|nr:hypothetical protein [Streptomyces sp. DSM 41699]MDT0469865.1 hypothetical protein [Streptomyces sp. DSM 41699]